nr:ATP-dependent DNA helicase PcrA [Chlamydiota bacterium]
MALAEKLNPKQLEAVTHERGPLLVLAGAGSGKTRIVTFRIAHLIESGISPNQILAVTFTNKAAGEMQERINQLTRGQGLESYPTICTFHSLGCRILRESIHHLGFKPNFIIYDEQDASKLLKGCMQTMSLKREAAQFKIYRNLISRSKDLLQEPGDVDLTGCSHELQKTFPELYRLYQERLKEANAVDFDDLLFLTVRLFQEHEAIRTDYQERWPFLLIDEYQDTNYVQYLIAKMIAEKSSNIFVVGDPDQSIYSWRGANIRNILDFEKDYPGAKIVRLEQNYRSRETILEAANVLIQHNFNRYEKNLWSERGPGEKIAHFVAENEREEASFVVHELERLHTVCGIPLKEMTIFYRTSFEIQPHHTLHTTIGHIVLLICFLKQVRHKVIMVI